MKYPTECNQTKSIQTNPTKAVDEPNPITHVHVHYRPKWLSVIAQLMTVNEGRDNLRSLRRHVTADFCC